MKREERKSFVTEFPLINANYFKRIKELFAE